MRAARHYVVTGRVQGVGFRFFTARAAKAEDVHGWVANRPDGAVEVVAEGEVAAVDRFERHLRQGPPRARVDEVRVADVASEQRTGFSIRS